MPEDVFWTRYFFRAYQIDREAERRKALLQGDSFFPRNNQFRSNMLELAPSDSEDAFSWEDDEEAVSSVVVTAPSSTGSRPSSTIAPSGSISHAPPQTLSPRESSEESFDVVSNSPEDLPRAGTVNTRVQDEEEDEDDDEDDDDDEGEDENEDEDEHRDGSEDSDWE
jgi:hypothetical protein